VKSIKEVLRQAQKDKQKLFL
jgi:hypothetical protein